MLKEKHIKITPSGSYSFTKRQIINGEAIVINKNYPTIEECILFRDMYIIENPPLKPYNYKTHPLYITWSDIMKRTGVWKTTSELNKKMYIEKGITVSKEWKDSFETFVKDMGEKPSELHQLDRIDNSKGYSKENCRWVTRGVNNFNQSSYSHMRKNNLPRGVYPHLKKYIAQIGIEGIIYYLGSFKTIKEAQKAYETMALEWYGFLPKNKIAK